MFEDEETEEQQSAQNDADFTVPESILEQTDDNDQEKGENENNIVVPKTIVID